MAQLDLADILEWTGGDLIHAGTATRFDDVGTDTRSLVKGSLFIALRGQTFDGHRFIKAALSAGAAGLLIDDRSAMGAIGGQPDHIPVIFVSNTLEALQDIAAGYRETLSGQVVAITGSVGKTSTRQMIAACLEQILQVHQTEGNLNNEIGLPLTLLKAKPSDQVIILEMGMRGPGEITLLSRIARPDIAVVTNIGLSHIGRLGSRAAICKAKTEIVDGLRAGGLVILNGDDALLRDWGRTAADTYRIAYVSDSGDKIVPGRDQADMIVSAANIYRHADGSRFDVIASGKAEQIGSARVNLPFPGAHHIHNTLFGLAVSIELGVSLEIAAAGAAGMKNVGNRQRIFELGGMLIMDDSYNASPESMLAAIDTLADLAGSRRLIAALGGMLELGDYADKAHYDLGRAAVQKGFKKLFLVGGHARSVIEGARSASADVQATQYDDPVELARALMTVLRKGDCLLIKGSRGHAMEKVTRIVTANRSETEICDAD